MEQKLNASKYINTSMIVGFQKPFVTALIVPNFFHLKKWCEANNVHWTGPQFMAINPKVEAFMKTVIEEINAPLKNEEKVRKFHLCYEPWEVATGEMTYTLKLKRGVLLEKFKKDIDKMYA